MTMIKIKYYTDPGHGWFAVKRDLLVKLGIQYDVSHYSYQRGATVYLEEDCDATLLFNRARATGIEIAYTEKHTDTTHPIRSYDHYRRTA
jgi:hypothetical protein